jgi:hypothetical protein
MPDAFILIWQLNGLAVGITTLHVACYSIDLFNI